DALGVEFSTRGTRIEEQIDVLRRLWSEPTIDHSGPTDTIDAAGIEPRPAHPVPIWLGTATAPRALARVGRLADGWLPMPDIQPGSGFDDAWEVVRTAAIDAGRDPSTIGLEGSVRVRAGAEDRVRDRVARWRDRGADAVAVNPLRDEARWPDGHLDRLLRAAEHLG